MKVTKYNALDEHPNIDLVIHVQPTLYFFV